MKKFSIGLTLALGLALLSPQGAFAAATFTGQVQRIYPSGNNGVVYFKLKNDTCNTQNKYYYLDTAAAGGADLYKLLLSSALAGQSITVNINANCGFTANTPINYLYQDY